MAARTITAEETGLVHELIDKARGAMRAIEAYDQPTVDRLCRPSPGPAGTNRRPSVSPT